MIAVVIAFIGSAFREAARVSTRANAIITMEAHSHTVRLWHPQRLTFDHENEGDYDSMENY